uniref:Family with sequence similarity 117 member A n=1 Tax=Lepisosteus oculatus TaxID=7918 RepID=W5N180_LEPOC
MSCRSGVGVVRGGAVGLQPLRATVPFQLHSKSQPRGAQSAEKTKSRPPKPSIRRTLSLDTIIGPYLQGHWPKDQDGVGMYCMNDKATQVRCPHIPDALVYLRQLGVLFIVQFGSSECKIIVAELTGQLKRGARMLLQTGYCSVVTPPPPTKVSALLSPQTPLSRLTPRLRHSVEGLNLELEGVFVREPSEEHPRVLDVPDGHRAPVPPQRCSSSSQSDPSPAPLDPALLSLPPSPSSPLGDAGPDLGPDPAWCRTHTLHPPMHEAGLPLSVCVLSPDLPCGTPLSSCPSPVLQLSSSPLPNKSYSFQREPPEGCERVRACEEALSPCLGQAFLLSCPDRNKVNFTPTGSAFCPVSLLKPLLPSMDFLFRSLSVSPVTAACSSGGGPVPCQ